MWSSSRRGYINYHNQWTFRPTLNVPINISVFPSQNFVKSIDLKREHEDVYTELKKHACCISTTYLPKYVQTLYYQTAMVVFILHTTVYYYDGEFSLCTCACQKFDLDFYQNSDAHKSVRCALNFTPAPHNDTIYAMIIMYLPTFYIFLLLLC